MGGNKDRNWLIPVSFFIIYIVWGSTYLANAWGIKSFPPILFAGIRFTISGILLYFIINTFKPLKITKAQWLNAAYMGFIFFTAGNGMVVWALKYIDTGICALIVAFQPLLTVVMLWLWKGEKPDINSWIGVVLGIIGMGLLIGQPELGNSKEWLLGAIATIGAVVVWTYGVIWIRDGDVPENPIHSAAIQMWIGGAGLLIFSCLLGEYKVFEMGAVDDRAFWSLIYLITIGSIIAFSAFNYLLKNTSPTKVVTSAFVNPLVALFLGWMLNNEHLTFQSSISTLFLLTGVIFIIKAKAAKEKTA